MANVSKHPPRSLIVIKKPRSSPIKDIPIKFPPLDIDRLMLFLLENKKKLKKGLPLTPHIPKKPPASSSTQQHEKEKKASENEASSNVEEELQQNSEQDSAIEILKEDDGSNSKQSVEKKDSKETKSTPPITEPPPEEETEPQAPAPPELTPEQKEIQEREDLLFQFRLLKKKYPKGTDDLPNFNEHDSLYTMKTIYDRKVKELRFDRNFARYKGWLPYAFIFMEYLGTSIIGEEFKGFAKAQWKEQDQYDELLYELGDRSYMTWTNNLPVEIRLIGMLIIQAGLFLFTKIIAKNAGGMFGDMFRAPPVQQEQQQPQTVMRGPSIKVGDIRKPAASLDEKLRDTTPVA